MTAIHAAIFANGARHRDRAAIIADAAVTYGDLVDAATRLAGRIAEAVPPGRRVAVLSVKRPATVLGFLATLAAGRAYVPVDPSAPAGRRAFILRDADCAMLLAAEGRPVDDAAVPVIRLPDEMTQVEPDRAPWPLVPVRPDDDAYVLYTSGSTGVPKGVRITHRNAAAFVEWAAAAYPLKPEDAVAQHAPLHFDLPVYDIYAGLSAGAAVHLVDERTALFPQATLDFLADRRITSLYAVPSALTAMVHRATLDRADLGALRQLLYAGEEFRTGPLAALWDAIPHAAVSNLYGPIETNVITAHRLRRDDLRGGRVPIGRPLKNVTLALVDADGRASEHAAMEGEIVVASDCVTPGYLNRPDLTARATTIVRAESGRYSAYRTGDYATRDADGVLHLIGRRDGLVKTRGYRVEVGDVEAAIGHHPSVAEVAVIPRPDPQLTNRLDAVVAARPGHTVTSDLLLRHCREALPTYMVPTSIVLRAELPRTSTGKISRSALLDLLEGDS